MPRFTILLLVVFLSGSAAPRIAGAAEASATNPWAAKARQKGITAWQRTAYAQLAQLHEFKSPKFDTGTLLYQASRPNPMTVLRDMDVKVLPILAGALSDDTPTKTEDIWYATSSHRAGQKPPVHVWKVNELVAFLIRDITDEQFFVGEINLRDVESHRDRIAAFQKQILEWYQQNKNKTREEREIEKLNGDLQHRIDAAAWLGHWKSAKAVPSLIRRADRLLAQQRESHSSTVELATISAALGQIGDRKALPTVEKVCNRLSSLSPSWSDSSAYRDLFSAFHGLALFGHKKEAFAELKRIYEKRGPKMQPTKRAEYKKRLGEAESW